MSATAAPIKPATSAQAGTLDRSAWYAIALVAVTAACLVLGLAWPLGLWGPPDAITDPEPLSRMLGETPLGLARLLLTLVLWTASYAGALLLSRRTASRTARMLLVAGPVLFALVLLPTWPAASKDVYHYILEGRTLVFHGENPLTTAPAELDGDRLFWILSSWQWEPARYGPLWVLIAAVPARIAGDDLVMAVLGFKAIVVLAHLATGLLVWRTASRLAPSLALPAYVFVAWNPLFLFESAASGHNDALMVAFTALALERTSRRDWTLAFPALAAAVLIKYVTGLLGPLLLIWAWRTSGDSPGERRSILLGLGLAAWLVVAAYATLWDGMATLAALSGAAGDALNSPGWLLREGLLRAGVSERVATPTVGIPLWGAFLVGYAVALRIAWRGRGAPLAPWSAGLLSLGIYLATASWWFWPWYITWLLPLAAVLVGRPAAGFVAVWSLAALAAYVPITYRPYFWGEPSDARMPLAVALTVFLPTATAALWLLARGLRFGSPRQFAGSPRLSPTPDVDHP